MNGTERNGTIQPYTVPLTIRILGHDRSEHELGTLHHASTPDPNAHSQNAAQIRVGYSEYMQWLSASYAPKPNFSRSSCSTFVLKVIP
jgi:hypothetical protein